MPELPEVESVARSLRPRVVGRRIEAVETSGLRLRHAVDERSLAAAATGARIERIDRIGKYLLVRLSSANTLLVHLGMSGRLVATTASARRAPHTHVVFRLDEGELRYVDPRRFGLIAVYPDHRVAASAELAVLGPDPLSDAFTVEDFTAALASSRRDAKSFLMDQGRVAGLGNIYVCEALFRARISPKKRADTIARAAARRLFDAIGEVLRAAVKNRGTTFRSYVDGQGEKGGNQHYLAVYGREGEPCTACGTTIRRIVQSARSTFYCPRCQR